jgi:two-component system sensor histidine kinase BaeS
LHADKDLSDIEVDPKYFRMALENIIDNASKYTRDAGSIAVTIHPEGSNVVIRIADTGVGIAAEDLHNLFTKFNRIPNELSQQVSGSGLGLYWVWNILQLHGGNVSAESELGRGTTFIITVPLENDHA